VSTIDVDLPKDIFDVQVNVPLIHQVVVAQQAAARQGTHSTKTRGEVSGGGAKPYRQKGTGRARQGSSRAPQFAGGGIVHGPTPRSYAQRTPKKMKAAALRGALSDRARAGRIHVVDSFVTGGAPSTKTALSTLRGLTGRPRILIVIERGDDLTARSLRNIADLHVLTADQLNTYDVLHSDDVVFTKAAFDAFVALRSNGEAGSLKLSDAAVEAVAPPAATKKATAKKADTKKADTKKADTKKATAKKATAEKATATEPKQEKAIEPKAAPAAAKATKTAPYGPGSKAPLKSGNAPKGHDVKGNENSMKYHTPDGQWYDQTDPEVWFDSVETAEAAGFSPAGGDDE